MNTSTGTRFTTKEMALIGIMTAVTCVLSPFTIMLPFSPIPITLGILAILLTAYILEPVSAMISVALYILIGLVGMPVFSSFGSGLGKLMGPTGGYIIGYLATVCVSSYIIHYNMQNKPLHLAGMALGVLLCYIFGTIWFSVQKGMSFYAALLVCVVPYIPGDMVKIIMAFFLGTEIRKRLPKSF